MDYIIGGCVVAVALLLVMWPRPCNCATCRKAELLKILQEKRR